MRPARLEIRCRDGDARVGSVHTGRGTFDTPCFMPVGTRGAVKLLDSADLEGAGAEVVLANAYHLMLRPGDRTVADLGGLHRFSGWDGHILTDSGGYQVFSLAPDVDDDGVTFRSNYDGSRVRLTPEEAVRVQEALGADIQMVLDVCCRLPAPVESVALAAERTVAWAARARAVHRRDDQSLFGIVQGGTSPDLRFECGERVAKLDFDGYAVGGLSVGESWAESKPALEAALAALPADRPRYLMGVGDPWSMLEAVALGVDMFDCVLPTRLGRHGTALTSRGKVQIRASSRAADSSPVDPGCGCPACSRYSAGYVRHLLTVGEPTGGRLLTIHNLHWMFGFVERLRLAIEAGQLDEVRAEISDTWKRDA